MKVCLFNSAPRCAAVVGCSLRHWMRLAAEFGIEPINFARSDGDKIFKYLKADVLAMREIFQKTRGVKGKPRQRRRAVVAIG